MQEAWRQTRKDGAAGVDNESAEEFSEKLDERLEDLLSRALSGRYQAPPVRRSYVPKGTGAEKRPIGIPTLEDKVLQRAVVMLLEAIYEEDFKDFSYGFRPGRSQHAALDTLWRGIQNIGDCWVLDADVRKYFDRIDHGQLRKILDRRVRDGVIRRLIDKWLKAGVWEDGKRTVPKSGTPQGGVISPLLSNIYLHEVLDSWFVQEVQPRLRGRARIIRFADDFLLVFESQHDAERVLEVLPKRLGRFGLELHPEKTRLIHFHRPRKGGPRGSKRTRSEVFQFLGFTHYWGRSRRGRWVVKRRTASDRLSRSLRKVADWCRRHRHRPVREQHRQLARKVVGHYAYYGITGNGDCLGHFRYEVSRIWRKWLDRRTRPGTMPWKRFHQLLERYPLPAVKIYHSIYAAKPLL